MKITAGMQLTERQVAAAIKAWEARLRRLAAKQGYRLVKGRPQYIGADSGYMLIDPDNGGAVIGSRNGFSFMADREEIEEWLTAPEAVTS